MYSLWDLVRHGKVPRQMAASRQRVRSLPALRHPQRSAESPAVGGIPQEINWVAKICSVIVTDGPRKPHGEPDGTLLLIRAA